MSAKTPEFDPADGLAAFLKAAGDPLRVQILRVLAQDSFGVMELASLFDVKQSGMSHHLKLLAHAGLVATRREGNSIFYRRALAGASPYAALQESLYRQVDSLACEAPVLARLEQIRSERVISSQAFFSDNSDKFRSQQDLIASYPVYAEQVTEMLQQVIGDARQSALEIGPGEGEFLSVLSPLFEQVWAIDINQAMLDQAAKRVEQEQLANVTLKLVAGENLSQALAGGIDMAVANMVLHHVPSPATVFQSLAQVLRADGSFIVTDLCLHDQNWAREACGDVWLGFDPDELSQWAEASGFSVGKNIYFALRNGFQIQVRQFIKCR
ncbi:ArsR/SmtB family transcription factor [Halioxenophilus aromaticivorans]|uniref:Metalloregulator ArsR/SmtB family transcription factor n=1 Tax=Halioxenophilus aromaticivorans TaxID=1306992 RepID=A0AAV3TZW6_9ALTE